LQLSIEVRSPTSAAVVVPRSCSSTSRRGRRTVPAGWPFRPVKELRAFAKVWLDPGETMIVSLELNERSFAYYDVVDTDWLTLVDRMRKRCSTTVLCRLRCTGPSRAGTSIRVPTSSTSAGRPPTSATLSMWKRRAATRLFRVRCGPCDDRRGPADEVRDCRLRLDRTIDPVGSEQPSLRATRADSSVS